jgi:DNA-binding CsgD family transcriptional regulator
MQKPNGRRRGPRPDVALAARIVKLFRAGAAPTEIARRVGCSPPHVYHVLRRADLWPRRTQPRPLSGAEAVIRRLSRAGMSQALLARLLGVSRVAVFKALRRGRPGAPAPMPRPRPSRSARAGSPARPGS